MRDSMVFYRNFRDALKKLPEKERLEAYEAIFAYAFDEIQPPDTIAGAFAQTMVPMIDKNNKRYEDGKKGGRPPKNQTETASKPSENHTETTSEPKCKSVRVKECKDVKCESDRGINVSPDGDREKAPTALKREPQPRITPPTVEEVEAYCFERNNKVDAERFVDFYSSNGWKVGKNPMKDWKAAVRTWEKRDDNIVTMTTAQQMEAARNRVLDQIIGGAM